MKIYLFLQNKLLCFVIPQKVSGNYSFDENPEETAKLINVRASDGNWFLYSTSDSAVMFGDHAVEDLMLKENVYYNIVRGGIRYLIYATSTFDNSFGLYSYGNDIDLIIGNSPECNINYANTLINGVIAKLSYVDNLLYLNVLNDIVYINDIKALKVENNIINNGDKISIYGLNIVVYKSFIMINNPNGEVSINELACKVKSFHLQVGSTPVDKEIKDVDLYSKDDYFSKAPRIRRLIKTKEITLSPPPKSNDTGSLPAILTVGPMITMGLTSSMMAVNNISKIVSGEADISKSWPTLVTAIAMMMSAVLWPSLSKLINKKVKKAKKKELIEKYNVYLDAKKIELSLEAKTQREILIENLIPVDQCLSIIKNGNINFWDKRIEQNDFLQVRLGIGNEKLDVKVSYPEEGFTVEEDELKKQADKMVEDFKFIKNVPIGYSFYECKISAIMCEEEKSYGLINNIILQLVTFYSYEDIKIVVFTNDLKKDKWQYIKYLNHSFSNDRTIRFFSTNIDEANRVGEYLAQEMQNRVQLAQQEDGGRLFKPYYVVITDDYAQIKNLPFMKILTELDANLGFSLIMLENRMSQLPSKCNNFINVRTATSGILRNSFEEQEALNFYDEINYNIDMMDVARRIANIPIEFAEAARQLPDSITFLEMEKVGKVEQLNIMNRWDLNDATSSLKAEVGVDQQGNLMYLDLHEKFHGPHGLIAGMTGSGKSEFIITYILSMCINYSPDDVAFILIDYKGGGLAGAFENKTLGIYLPHLAGTITNLDKAEMDRTLVSIDSEIKRRQKIFNDARDALGESTIDIYKYQRFYKDGKLTEPIPHLFIICDEFAELKSQQPDFMDNLISVARIGRSLGVHLILATQKPSGVVNEQIWSNTKFRVCLKVQDESDSKEMLKRPEAASIKQTGRFYLQVGFDELFLLGQSGWCGAKYYPSEKIIKQVDKSINFIDDTGNIIKSIQAGNNIKIEAKGEQLSAILNSIIEVAKQSNKRAKRLWLNDIDPIILVDNLEKKYNIIPKKYDVEAILGEYDAPEKQEQGIFLFSVNNDGNTAIFGNDEIERENILNSIIYSICKNHGSDEISLYILDYGSEQLRMFNGLPQIGGMVFMGDEEKQKNLFKLITEEMKERKKVLASYGGSIDNYNNKNEVKMPRIVFIINNYEGLVEIYNEIYEEVAPIGRECERYGIVLIITCSTPSTMGRRVSQCFNNIIAMHLTDPSDYYAAFNESCKLRPKAVLGRGLMRNKDGTHEFQTSSIVEDIHALGGFIDTKIDEISKLYPTKAKQIPSLPDQITLDVVESEISTLNKVPIGISKSSLSTIKFDFTAYPTTSIASNKLLYINSFMDSLLDIFLRINNLTTIFVDASQLLPEIKNKEYNGKKIYYYDSSFEEVSDKIIELDKNNTNGEAKIIYIIYGLDRLKQKVDTKKIEELFVQIKSTDNSTCIICDSTKSLKSLEYESWYSKIKNNSDGIWIGKGFNDQQNFRISKITKEMSSNIGNDYGFFVSESHGELMKVLNFGNIKIAEDESSEE